MSEDSSSEKKHLPTSKRLDESRKQGQTLRSRDLSGALILFTNVIALFFMATQFKLRFEENFISSFTAIKTILNQPEYPGNFIYKMAIANFGLVMPIFLIVLIAALFSPFLFGGWNFTMSAVSFKWSKLSPGKFFKNIFSVKIFIEVFRSFSKALIIFGILIYFIFDNMSLFKQLGRVSVEKAIYGGFDIVSEFIKVICWAVVIVVLTDLAYHYHEFINKMKMSTQELKDESKDTDGNPEVKRKMKSAAFALLRQRLNSSVPQSTVVVTNPTHYAIALRYDENKDNAPKILAKGKDHIAQQIRQLAIANGVPIYQAPELARAIYHTGNIGSHIHPDLYMAVAIVLSYVHQLKNYQQGIGQQPKHTTDLKIPEELIYDE